MHVHLPLAMCRKLPELLAREWLVTNGLGGYASGTIAGALTRRHHGLMIASQRPPGQPTLLVARLDEAVTVRAAEHLIHSSVWSDGAVDPAGWRYLRRFDVVRSVPTWTFQVDAASLRKQIWMEHGRHITYVRYTLDPESPPVRLACRALVNCRPADQLARAGQQAFQVHAREGRLFVRPEYEGASVELFCANRARVTWTLDHTWYRGFQLPRDRERGVEHTEDHLGAGVGAVDLAPGTAVTFVIAVGEDARFVPHGELARHERRAEARLNAWADHWETEAEDAPPAVRQLVLAADAFIVRSVAATEADAQTVVAGYPQLAERGRDALIALPGLALVTGRFDLARQLLRVWAGGMNPASRPGETAGDDGTLSSPAADVALWYLWAVDQYIRATGDVETLGVLFPRLREMVASHRDGMPHGIRVADDGLIYIDEDGGALTWMDARVDGRPVTPRRGKPVELSALWYDGLCNLARLADLAGEPGDEFTRLAERTRASFPRFWNRVRGCCYDVLDGPEGDDPRVRPNQIFAVALTHSPLPHERQAEVVRACEAQLLTWFGLRTLAPGEPHYRERYAGGPSERGRAVHQGTVWGGLLGPFVLAHYRVHKDAAAARHLLEPLLGQLWTYGLGSLGEIFDATEPFAAHGCIAHAVAVAETLRAWHTTQRGAAPQRMT